MAVDHGFSFHPRPTAILPAWARYRTYQAGRPGLRSALSQRLTVPRTRLSSFGDQSFPVAGAEVWNDLPLHVTSAPTLSIFRNRLKTYLFNFSYPGIVN